MRGAGAARERPGLGTLLRELVEDSVALVRSEIQLVKIELARAAAAIGRGTAFVLLGTLLATLGALAVVIGLVLLAGDQWLPADMYWLAALIALVVTGGAALWLAKRGLAQFAPMELAPDQTMDTLKQDAQWLKRQVT